VSFEPRRIAILTGDHGLPDPTKRGAAYHEEDEVTHAAMVAAFRTLDGYDFEVWSDHASLLERMRGTPPDLIVNFCDTGFRNVPTLELNIPAYAELLGIPYTGAPPQAMVICYDKAIVRLVAEQMGVPVPRERFLPADTLADDAALDRALGAVAELLPALIKPNTADGSVGITKDAVVRTPAELRAYLDWLRATLPGRDALVQEYLPGTEYGIGLIGNPDDALTLLPALEVDYSGLPEGLNPILSFESKAFPDSPYWTDIRYKRATLAPAEEARLGAWGRLLFRRFGLRDYARFDWRTAADGTPRLMEVNPNPAWAPDAKLAMMAGFAGLEYRDMLRLFLDGAIARVRRERAAA
jgi:D-alanine-D-alanine ligase